MAACKACPPLLEVFSAAEFKRGREAARQKLAEAPNDEEAMYYLAKIDTSYLFLQLSTVGSAPGGDAVLGSETAAREGAGEEPESPACAGGSRLDGRHVVGTRVPWGTRWCHGPCDFGLRDMCAKPPPETGDFYSERGGRLRAVGDVDARRQADQAVPVARELLARFPDNEELSKFISGS